MKLSKDKIAIISDDDLNRRVRTIRGLIRNNRFSHEKLKELQTEFCYLHREAEVREARHEAHQLYLRQLRHNSHTRGA
jgi:hypothetical protein